MSPRQVELPAPRLGNGRYLQIPVGVVDQMYRNGDTAWTKWTGARHNQCRLREQDRVAPIHRQCQAAAQHAERTNAG